MAQTNFLIDVSGPASGVTYVVQTATNLLAASWTNQTSFVAGQALMTLTNDVGSATKKFYRIGVGP